MERGVKARGGVAGAVASAEGIETRATIPEHQVEHALQRFGLHSDNDQESFIYFFDIPFVTSFLAEAGAERDKRKQTKTRWALGHNAAKLLPPASATAPATARTRRRQ